MSKHKLKRERALAPRELRYLGNNDARFELRETSNGATITGYAALFAPSQTDMGSYSEVVAPTAFDAALKSGADVRALFNHDPNHVIGRTKAGTLRLSKDSRGLIYQADIPRTTWAQDLAETMRRGDVDQSSYGFFVPEDGEDWEMGQDGIVVRTLRNVNLFDVSPVTFPANPNTISKLRAQFPDGKEHIQERIATLRSTSFPSQMAQRSTPTEKTKSVDGVELPAASFAYVGDKSDPSTWSLPIHFPGDAEKTQDHIRLALAMFGRTEGIPASEKAEVYAKVVGAAKAHGIAVSHESLRDREDADDWTDPDPYGDDDTDDPEDALTGAYQGSFDADDEDEDGADEEDSLRMDRLRVATYFANLQANL
ncbi:MAG: HK97 family phage prohead protease [Acidobacteriaceae bacterium]